MNVSVFGLGYAGTVSAASLASDGHHVIGVDVSDAKVETVNAGKSPIVERDLEALLSEAVASRRLVATTEAARAVDESDISLVCVGTAGHRNGSLDLSCVERVCHEIAAALRNKSSYHLIVIRSTVLPGTTEDVLIPIVERGSDKIYGEGFGFSVNPEFLREGTAIGDFRAPPLTLIGHNHPLDGRRTLALYQAIDAPVVSTGIRTAEMVKYATNAWHALKICFANEIGAFCQGVGVDGHDVMEILCRDWKLNLSSSYLRPGFAFGGSCLPKDVRALQFRAKELDIDLPVIRAIPCSNRLPIQRAIERVLDTGGRSVGLLGLSFKAGTDDLRESPMVVLAEALLGRGLRLQIYDDDVSPDRIVGANRRYIEQQIPHLCCLLRKSAEQVVRDSDVIVVGKQAAVFPEMLLQCRADQTVIDLVRLPIDRAPLAARYEGLCW